MRFHIFLPVLAMLLAQGAFAITVTGHISPDPAVAVVNPCPQHPGYACNSTAVDVGTLTAGLNADFLAAWNTTLVGEWDPTRWTMQFSDQPLNVTLDVETYRAFNRGPVNEAGAEIRVMWTPSADQMDLKWVQAIHSNVGRHGPIEYYLDFYTWPPVYPYSYADLHFYDAPYRSCKPDAHSFWTADLYLARVNPWTRTATIYEGLSWGYTIDCLPVPEPSSIAALCLGLLVLVLHSIRNSPLLCSSGNSPRLNAGAVAEEYR